MSKPYFEVVVRVVKDDKVLVERAQAIGAQFKPELAPKFEKGKDIADADIMLAMASEIVAEMKNAPLGMMVIECAQLLRTKLGAKIGGPKHFQCKACSEVFLGEADCPPCPKCQAETAPFEA
jgi:hypothetical protein